MDKRIVYLFLPFFIAFMLFTGGISYGDIDVPEVKKPAPKVDVGRKARETEERAKAVEDAIRRAEEAKRRAAEEAKARAEREHQRAYADLLNRIEALESRTAGNVTAPKIRGLKIGFDIRHRFELRDSDRFSDSAGTRAFDPTTNKTTFTPTTGADGRAGRTMDFTLQRVRLSFDADVNKNVRAYIKLQDQRVFGEEGFSFAPTGTLGNLGRTDLLEGYVEARNLGDLTPMLKNIELRIGRWQAHYGNDRLIGHLNWTNQGRSYDGARVRWADKGNWVDLFAFQVEEFGPFPGGSRGVADISGEKGGPKLDEVLYGLYTHFKVYDGVVFEPYGIVRARSAESKFAALGGTKTGEQRYTAGFRLDGRKIGELPGVDFTVEPAWQFGKVEGQRAGDFNPAVPPALASDVSEAIQAWAVYAGVGYTFNNIPWTPRIGYAYVFASGDKRPRTGAAKTFDHLYPTGHAQLGYADYAAWQNIEDHQIHFSVKPTKRLVVDLKGHFFSLDEEADDWYGVAGGTGYGGGRARIRLGADQVLKNGVLRNVDDDLGQEIDVTLKYKLFNNFGVVAGYSHFFADDFIEDTGNGVDRGTDWAYLQTTVKF